MTDIEIKDIQATTLLEGLSKLTPEQVQVFTNAIIGVATMNTLEKQMKPFLTVTSVSAQQTLSL